MASGQEELTVGIDWGAAAHQVCVLDAADHVVAERRVAHAGAALRELPRWLATVRPGAALAVAIETPRSGVIDALLEAGLAVFVIHPRQVERFRERYTAAAAKDDRRDAWVLAHTLRTDRHAYRPVPQDAPAVLQLRELSRLDAELGEEITRLSNRLRDHLRRFFPQVLELSPAAQDAWICELLRVVPTPAHAAHVRAATLTRVLVRSRITRVSAADVLAILRAPAVPLAPGTTEALAHRVGLLLPHLTLLHTQRRQVEKQLAAALTALAGTPGQDREHHDVTILRSWPGIGIRIAATMLAEAHDALEARDYHAFRTRAGLAPVTLASGKTRHVRMRYACHTRLRTACFHWARTAMRADAHTRAAYDAFRQRGHSHPRALRGVADRQLAVLMAMLRSGTLYNPTRRRALPAAA